MVLLLLFTHTITSTIVGISPTGCIQLTWLYRFPWKLNLAAHPGVGVTQLTIGKLLRNTPSRCAARHPPAFEELE